MPDELSDDAATFVEPLACVVKSLRGARVRDDDRVLVVGLGVMGLLHLLAVKTLARPGLLVAADVACPSASRSAPGWRTRRSTLLTPRSRCATGDAGADVVIVCPGSVEALEAGRRAVAPGGTLAIFAPTPPGVLWPLSVHDLFFRETTLVPSYSAGPTDTREAMRLLAGDSRLSPLSLIGCRCARRRAATPWCGWAARPSKAIVRP